MKNIESEIKRITRHMPNLISELTELANESSMYARYSCSYLDQLSPVCHTVFAKAYKHMNPNGLSRAAFCNALIKGMITKPSKSII